MIYSMWVACDMLYSKLVSIKHTNAHYSNLMLGPVNIKRSICPVSDDSTSSQLMQDLYMAIIDIYVNALPNLSLSNA